MSRVICAPENLLPAVTLPGIVMLFYSIVKNARKLLSEMVVHVALGARNLLSRGVTKLDRILGSRELNRIEKIHAIKRVLRQDIPCITLERVATSGSPITYQYRLRNSIRVEWAEQIYKELFKESNVRD